MTDTWVPLGELPQNQVTTSLVPWGEGWSFPAVKFVPLFELRKSCADESRLRPSIRETGLCSANRLLAFLLAMGIYFSKREKTTQDFFSEGSGFPGGAAGSAFSAPAERDYIHGHSRQS